MDRFKELFERLQALVAALQEIGPETRFQFIEA